MKDNGYLLPTYKASSKLSRLYCKSCSSEELHLKGVCIHCQTAVDAINFDKYKVIDADLKRKWKPKPLSINGPNR